MVECKIFLVIVDMTNIAAAVISYLVGNCGLLFHATAIREQGLCLYDFLLTRRSRNSHCR
jgi:hypothetical protein